jgi:sterol desaturase/sphingolipid hydroxylase (fatty acid hydroxylase superfamily)
MEAVLLPLQFFSDPGKRIYWGYLISAMLVASLVTSYHQRTFDLKRQLAALTNRYYWFNRSTVVDYTLLFVNSVIRTIFILPNLGARLSGALIVASFAQANVGDVEVGQVPWLLIAILFSGVLFVVDDLSRFLLHRMMHRWPILWRMHKVHHSAKVLTPFTVFRIHPVESVIYFMRGMLVFSFIAGSFIWIFRGQLTALELLGVDALGFIFNMAAANLRHSHIRLSFGRLEGILISPTQHQLHHSKNHCDINYGSCLALWDNWGGSLVRANVLEANSELVFGLKTPTQESDRVLYAH